MEKVSPSEEEINIFIFKFVYCLKQISAYSLEQVQSVFTVQAAF